MVHAHDIDGHIVLRGRRDYYLFGATCDVQLSLGPLREDPGRLAHVVRTNLAPANFGWLPLVEDADVGAIDNEEILPLLAPRLDLALEAAMHTVPIQQIDHVVQVHEWLIDADHNDALIAGGRAEDQSADSAKAIDAQRAWHGRRLGSGRGQP